jgi:hypothetical protein
MFGSARSAHTAVSKVTFPALLASVSGGRRKEARAVYRLLPAPTPPRARELCAICVGTSSCPTPSSRLFFFSLSDLARSCAVLGGRAGVPRDGLRCGPDRRGRRHGRDQQGHRRRVPPAVQRHHDRRHPRPRRRGGAPRRRHVPHQGPAHAAGLRRRQLQGNNPSIIHGVTYSWLHTRLRTFD